MHIKVQKITAIATTLLLVLTLASCGGGTPSNNNQNTDSLENKRITDTDAIENSPLTSGGITSLTNEDSAIDGATLIIPPGAVTEEYKDITVSLVATSTLPANTPWGQRPIGSLFKAEPSGLEFDSKNKAILILPIPPHGPKEALYIGRWNEVSNTWEDLGGSIDGDFISTEVEHLSLYGIFPLGKSPIRLYNNVTRNKDPDNRGIEIRYISGPLPFPDWPSNKKFSAERPFSRDSINLKSNESQLMMLSPGQYHFTVSYLSPSLLTNDLLFRIPELTDSQKNEPSDNVTEIDIEVVRVFKKGELNKENAISLNTKRMSRNNKTDGFIKIQQTITISENGASSDNELTNNSLKNFPGKTDIILSNQPPTLTCSAYSQQAITITNRDADAEDLPSRRIAVGPILNKSNDSRITLTGTAIDPEDDLITYYWTWSGENSLPSREIAASGREVDFFYSTRMKREGRYDVYLTAYDDENLFDECHWEIAVRGNEKPIIKVVSDYRIIDYGRFGDTFTQGDRLPLGELSEGESWCDYTNQNRVRLKSLELLGDSEKHINRPTQYPAGMTCLFAMVGDVDDDPLTFEFKLPFTGSFYSALDGNKITTEKKLKTYNSLLSSTISDYPIPEPLKQFAPDGAKFALPIVWEAPDNVGTLDSNDSSPTHDCRHYENVPPNMEPCLDWGRFPDGGMTAIRAQVTDGYSRKQTSYDWVGYGIQPIIKLAEVSVEASDANATEPTDGVNDTGTFTMTRNGGTDNALLVTVQITGTATQSTDYIHISTTITIPAGKESIKVIVTPLADTINEGTETVTLKIVNNKDMGYLTDEESAQATMEIVDTNGSNLPPPPTNTGPTKLVLEGVYFNKTDKNSDLCGDTQTCLRFVQKTTSPTQSTEWYYFISQGTAEYRIDQIRENPTRILSEYRATFSFDQPPERITAGSTINLTIEGTALGFYNTGSPKRSFRYFLAKPNENIAWNDFFHETRVTLTGFPWNKNEGSYKGTATENSTTEIVIPENATEGFSIGGWFGWDPAIRIYWVYKLEE